MEDLFITADWVLPIANAPVRDGAVLVHDGRIDAVGPTSLLEARATGARRVDLGRAAVLPGLVNVHAHLELTGLRGYLEGLDFFAWIRELTSTKYERLSGDHLLASSRWGVAEMTRAGVTTVGEVCDVGVSPRALREGGLRAVVFQEVFGPDPAQATSSIAGLEARLAAHEPLVSSRLKLGVSPHAAYTVSPALFQLVSELALERDLSVTIHAAETAAEVAFVSRGEGPFAEFLRGRKIDVGAYDVSTIRRLDDLGVLRCRPLLVHCIHCDDDDIGRITSHGASIAHCPKSNAKLGHGVAPWREMRGAGATVGLGSDGVVCNNSIDLFEEARVAALFDRARLIEGPPADEAVPNAAEVLRLLTVDGARALGLDDEVGTLEEGKAADLCAVSLSGLAVEPVHDIETALVWSASAADVVLTVVEGELLYDGGELRRWDVDELRAEMQRIPGELARPGGSPSGDTVSGDAVSRDPIGTD